MKVRRFNMRITKQTYPKLWLLHERFTDEERRNGFDIDDAEFWKFRAEQNETHPHLSDAEKDLNAIYNAHQHPGFKPAAPAPVKVIETTQAPVKVEAESKINSRMIAIALWIIVFLLILLLSGVKLHAQSVTVRGVPLGTTTAANVTVTAACIANHNCFDVDLLNIPHIICDSGCGGAASFSDNSAFTVGTTAINVIGAYYTSGSAPTLSTGNAGRVRMDSNSYLYTDCVVGCSGGATTPADAFSNPTTAGLQFDLLAGFNGTTWDRLRDDTNKYLYVDCAIGCSAASNYALESGGNLDAIATDLGGTLTVQPSGGLMAVDLQYFGSTGPLSLGQQIAANSIPVILPSATITTLTPPTAAAIGTAVATDLLIGTQLAAVSEPVALPTATITTLTPPTAAAIASAIVANPPTVPVTGTFYPSTQPVSIASAQVASGAIASGAVASGAIASGACAVGCIADGGEVTLGAKADAKSTATDTTPITVMSVLKQISASVQAPPSQVVSCSTACEVSPTTAANTVSNPFFNTLTDNAGHANTYNSTTTSSKYGADANILSILGTAPTTAGKIDIKGADGDVFVRQTTGTNLHVVTDATSVLAANQSVNLSQVNAHTTAECGLNGCQSVGGATADGAAATTDPVPIAGKGAAGVNRVPVVCDNWAPFSLASTTALKIITLVSGKNIYICSINIVSAAANNVALIDGTNSTTDCNAATHGMAGGTTAATGWNFAANSGLTQGSGIGVIAATVTVSHDVCLLASGSGQVSGVIGWTDF
jgi:hypothetical protein